MSKDVTIITKKTVFDTNTEIPRKPFYVENSLLDKVRKQKATGSKRPIRTRSRRSTIIPEFVDETFEIYNGKVYITKVIRENMIGQKLGEYAPTRTFKGHSGKEKVAAGKPKPKGGK